MGAVTAVQSPTMAEDNVEYDLLEDVGEELDYEDFTLEDEDLGMLPPGVNRHMYLLRSLEPF